MILMFNRKSFVESIRNGTKIHTIRADRRNRWKEGMTIHFWKGNPRIPKSNPYRFGIGKCSKVFEINIDPESDWVTIKGINQFKNIYKIDDLNEFAVNDGFKDWEDMKTWFAGYFEGHIIFWEEFVAEK